MLEVLLVVSGPEVLRIAEFMQGLASLAMQRVFLRQKDLSGSTATKWAPSD